MPDADSENDSESPTEPDEELSDEELSDEELPDEELPEETVAEAERLTRLAREAVDDAEADAYREDRDELLGDHDFTARVREENPGETLILHPDEWVEDGTIRTDRIEDTGRAVELSLSGPGDPDEWNDVDEHNREVAALVREAHGEVHGDNAASFADFMSNHYAKPIESATSDEVDEFLSEYFPRNAWPTEEQRAAVEESIEYVFETADGQ